MAFFFSVSVADLLDEAPLTLWEYASAQPNFIQSCIGRDWELEQLQRLYTLSKSASKIVSIVGMKGIGKTTLIDFFLSKIKTENENHLYISLNATPKPIQRLSRLMLGLADNDSDVWVRGQLKALAKPTLLYFYLLLLTGVALDVAETLAIDSMKADRRAAIEGVALELMIQTCIARNVSVLVIDDLHDMAASDLGVIKKLTESAKALPFLLILSISDIKQFCYLPDWLQQTHLIQLNRLDDSASASLADMFMKTKGVCSRQHAQQKVQSIARSKGHPEILAALLKTPQPDRDFPDCFYKKIVAIVGSLSMTHRQLLRYLASIGDTVCLLAIEQFLTQTPTIGVTQLNDLVCSGLLYPRANGYAFRHFFIFEIVKDHMSKTAKVKGGNNANIAIMNEGDE